MNKFDMNELSQSEKSIWSYWEAKTPREVVREAASKGAYIKLAHQYLQIKNGWDRKTAEEWFTAEVYAWVVQLLIRKQFFKASHVLGKINVSPHKHILNIAKGSVESEVRDYIIEQLKKTTDLQAELGEEWTNFNDNWNLLRLLQNSFDLHGIQKQNKIFGSGSERIVLSMTGVKELNIEKINNLSPESKKIFACYLFIETFDFSIVNFLDPEYIWKILLQKNFAILLRRWIILSNNKEKHVLGDSDLRVLKLDAPLLGSQELLDKVDELLSKWPITTSMINIISECDCFDFTSIYVYDTLCSFGHVVDSEQSDFKLILSRLSRTQNLSNAERIFSTIKATHHIDLNDMIVKYCIKNNLFYAMMACVNIDNLSYDIDDIIKCGTSNCLDLWLLFKHFQNSDDMRKITFSIYETCKYLTDDLADYFSQNSPLIIAMLLFENRSLFDIFIDDQTLLLYDYTVKWNKVLHSSWPHLYSVYNRWKNNSIKINNDVTVYQLLSGYKGLDIAKMFEFQLTEQLRDKSRDSITSSSESIKEKCDIPHFSNKEFVQKYSYKKKLNYFHYLKQNRPCLASLTLLPGNHGFRPSNVKIIRNACNQAHVLAIKNWDNNIITASCISFITMVGCDSTKCRTHITCAKLIESYFEESENMSKADATAKVNDLMDTFLSTSDFSIDLLEWLIKAVEANTGVKEQSKSTSDFGQFINEWQTAVKFAYFHNLPLPEAPLRKFIIENEWLSFLLFGDVFKYPKQTMVTLCREFKNQSLVEHLMQAIIHNDVTRKVDMRSSKLNSNDHRRISNEKTIEMQLEKTKMENMSNLIMSDDLWEIMANSHGPEDPPDALIKASALYHCPLLALLATCYEPDAVDMFWAQWLITSMKKEVSEKILEPNFQDASELSLNDEQIKIIIEISIENNYYYTLRESIEIFYKDSPLCILLNFFVKTVKDLEFNSETVDLLKSFQNQCKRSFPVNNREVGRISKFMNINFIRYVTVDLIIKTLCDGFASAWYQKEFLRCLCEVEFSKDFPVDGPDFWQLFMYLNISMTCGIQLDLKKICHDKSSGSQMEYIDELIKNKLFNEAMHFANFAELSRDKILIAEWSDKYAVIHDDVNSDDNDFIILQFLTKCSHNLKMYEVTPKTSIEFLKKYCDEFNNPVNKFYMLRIILGWFETMDDKDLYINETLSRDLIEYEMWNAYLSCSNISIIKILDFEATNNYVINITDMKELYSGSSQDVPKIYFKKLLSEINEKANLSNMKFIENTLNNEQSEKWKVAIVSLVNSGLIVEAWRLNKIYKISPDSSQQTFDLLLAIETCLQIAEGIISPYDLPSSLRHLVAASSRQRSSDSQLSDSSFEELVLIPDKAEEVCEDNSPLAGRRDADALSIIETLGIRTCCTLIRQVSDYFRIALQIGWSYERVLKFSENPLDLINQLSGRGRMHLSKIVFRAFDLSPAQIMGYLCYEVIQAVVSPHLTRTSGFRQKEHFHYTLWGYPLESDFEMFLNLRPANNSMLGRKILEYLSAFRKFYKCPGTLTVIGIEPNCDAISDSQPNSEGCDDGLGEIDSISEYNDYRNDTNPPIISTSPNVIDNQSIASSASTTNSYPRKKINKKNQQLDVISCTNMHVPSIIYTNIKMLMKNTKLSTKQINVVSIELLVLAHDCFSSVCDTEGIAIVLRSAQTLTSHLLVARSWRLMVRLLTGIARYTEMAFIFQTLRDHDQFEFLLGQFDYMLSKCDDKINNYKQGLLEYLRMHCPGDTELYCMVALHFNMHSEVGDVKKKQANDLLTAVRQMALDSMKVIKKRPREKHEWIILANNDSSLLLLEGALTHCIDAAELYAKGECLGAARELAALAQLTALQISLIRKPPTKCLFDLSKEEAIAAIDTYLSFMEGLVFAEANDATSGGWVAEWKEIVYQRVMRGDDPAFVKDIISNRPDIAYYIIQRYDTVKKSYEVPENKQISELRSIFK